MGGTSTAGPGRATTSRIPAGIPPWVLERVVDVERPAGPIPFVSDHPGIPGPRGLATGIATVSGMRRHGQRYLSKLARRHGPVFRTVLATDPVVMVAHPDHIWTIIKNEHGAFSTGLPWRRFFEGIEHGGPLWYDGVAHREVRRLLGPAFAASAIGDYIDAAYDLYDRRIEGWITQGGVSFKSEIRRLFAAVSARVFMGIEDPGQADALDRAMTDGWQAVLTLNRGSALSPGWRRAKRGNDEVWKIIRSKQQRGSDLLSRLLETRDEADWLDDEDTRLRLFVGVMFGAFDTTAAGTAAMAYLLARHPEWQARVREEVLALDTPHPGPADLKRLETLTMVWKESLRLMPVAGLLARATLAPTSLGSYELPAGSLVLALSGTAGQDPHWWTQPERFDPLRFSAARAEERNHKATFLPFGGGPHACIGAQMATAEVAAFWHACLRRCRLRLRRDYEARHQYLPIGLVSGGVDLVLEPL